MRHFQEIRQHPRGSIGALNNPDSGIGSDIPKYTLSAFHYPMIKLDCKNACSPGLRNFFLKIDIFEKFQGRTKFCRSKRNSKRDRPEKDRYRRPPYVAIWN